MRFATAVVILTVSSFSAFSETRAVRTPDALDDVAPGLAPRAQRLDTADAASTGTVILELRLTSLRPRVSQKTTARLEQQFSPDAAEIAATAHAVFVLRSGGAITKAVMYDWAADGTLEIGVPFSDKWDIAAVYVGQIRNAAGTALVAPLFIAGSDFAADFAAAPAFDIKTPGQFIPKTDAECFQTAGDACGVGADGEDLYPHICYSCWWRFCGAPRNQCM